jgi:hypothetical protein
MESGWIKVEMKIGWKQKAFCECVKISIGYKSIGAAFCNDDKLHVPLGTPL